MHLFLLPSERHAGFYSAVMWEKQEDALLHCDSAINTIIPIKVEKALQKAGQAALEMCWPFDVT